MDSTHGIDYSELKEGAQEVKNTTDELGTRKKDTDHEV
jgi:hypothetical protein